ncbi:MAG: response regulator receiver protein [Magnetococcales bacterium]|nr:response regulator receiver protein [Magnetococcales bacterium]HIJ83355.1 response regulator [Magnetococcales bacterium]
MKILIADDDDDNRLLLSKIVAQQGSADLVVDGQEALEAFGRALAHSDPYDVVFLDIMMPRLDGLQALSRMRKLEKTRALTEENAAKIFMVTALGTEKNVLAAFLEGECNDFLIKPINKRMVFEKLLENGILLK